MGADSDHGRNETLGEGNYSPTSQNELAYQLTKSSHCHCQVARTILARAKQSTDQRMRWDTERAGKKSIEKINKHKLILIVVADLHKVVQSMTHTPATVNNSKQWESKEIPQNSRAEHTRPARRVITHSLYICICIYVYLKAPLTTCWQSVFLALSLPVCLSLSFHLCLECLSIRLSHLILFCFCFANLDFQSKSSSSTPEKKKATVQAKLPFSPPKPTPSPKKVPDVDGKTLTVTSV